MYYPYLRAKQFELLAIREFAAEEGDKRIFPIIEPVKKAFNSLNKALEILAQNELPFALILNPLVGDIKQQTNLIETSILQSVRDSPSYHPAFILHNATPYDRLLEYIEEKEYNNVLLILSSVKDIDNRNFINLCNSNRVNFFVFETENRSLKRRLAGKNLILLKDNFNMQKRNADYLIQNDELFTEEHAFFLDDGYAGFSDYTTIGKDFIDGGRLPYAVAIHLTYEKNPEQIWIKHFVSDTNDDNSNIQGKFGEAATKAIRFINEKNMDYEACNELRRYFTEEAYPGLGMIKKISIKNHIELVNDILTR